MGTEYNISYLPDNECINKGTEPYFGLTDIYKKEIKINQNTYFDNSDNNTDPIRARHGMNVVMRHEIIHAFFEESGLDFDYCHDETLVDWIAIKIPQIVKTMADMNIMLEAS